MNAWEWSWDRAEIKRDSGYFYTGNSVRKMFVVKITHMCGFLYFKVCLKTFIFVYTLTLCN